MLLVLMVLLQQTCFQYGLNQLCPSNPDWDPTFYVTSNFKLILAQFVFGVKAKQTNHRILWQKICDFSMN